MDAEIELRRNEKLDTRSWRSSKLKDEKDGTGYGFRLAQHQLGFDADGDPETSCTVERVTFVDQKTMPRGTSKKPAYHTIKTLISKSNITGKAGAPFSAPCIKIDDALTDLKNGLATTEPKRRMTKAKALVDSLTADNFFVSGIDSETGEGWIWLPDE